MICTNTKDFIMKRMKHKTYEWNVEEGSLKLFVDDQKPYLSAYVYNRSGKIVEELFYTGELAERYRAYFKRPSELMKKLLSVLNREFSMDEFEKFTLDRDDEKKISFTGKMIATAYTTPGQDGSYPSGSTGRSETIELYETKGGKFVCNHIWVTQWDGEQDRHEVFIVENDEEIINVFGQSDMAKRLYYIAGIDNVEEIE